MNLELRDFSGAHWESLLDQNVQLSVDLAYLMRAGVIRREEIPAGTNQVVDSFRGAVGPSGNLSIAVFNFQFGETGIFSVCESPSQVGRFSEELRKQHCRVRTPAPFYSFLHFGPHSIDLDPYPFVRSSGEGSPFSFQIDRDYVLLAVGHHINKALSFVHHVESVVRAPWRSDKWFSGTVVRGEGIHENRAVQFLVREPGVRFSSLTVQGDFELRRRGVIESGKAEIGGKSVTVERARLGSLMEELVGSFSSKQPPWIQPVLEGKDDNDVLTPQKADRLFWQREKSFWT